ncbi:MAG: GSCFA domain-containing protein [Bacteroidales bacterium]|nr:GSCFA domain-containing protein [Bacteroidales bacterium]
MLPLQTTVEIVQPPFSIDHNDKVLLLGSCFSDNIGTRMQQAGFNVMCNPFGPLYNPMSIGNCLRRSLKGEFLTDDDLVFNDGMWHSWYHYGSFSATDKERCLEMCNESMKSTADFLRECDIVVITLGTAYVYHLIENGHRGRVVSNCHRVEPSRFERRLLNATECRDALWTLPIHNKRTIITVSPIRHLADSAHGNQLSKSRLLLATELYSEQRTMDDMENGRGRNLFSTYYFPAYEIMLDELRDYRFYDRDMVHPSSLAIDIIWQRFQNAFFSPSTQNLCRQNEKEYRRTLHRPISRQ